MGTASTGPPRGRTRLPSAPQAQPHPCRRARLAAGAARSVFTRGVWSVTRGTSGLTGTELLRDLVGRVLTWHLKGAAFCARSIAKAAALFGLETSLLGRKVEQVSRLLIWAGRVLIVPGWGVRPEARFLSLTSVRGCLAARPCPRPPASRSGVRLYRRGDRHAAKLTPTSVQLREREGSDGALAAATRPGPSTCS